MFFFKKNKIPLSEVFPTDFVDLHSHLLPGIDDGAKTLEDAITLLTRMRSYGIKNFITTPHVLGAVYPNSTAMIHRKLNEVKEALVPNNLQDINIRAAAEYMLDEQFYERMLKDDLLVLKDNYVLVEMSYFSAPLNLYEMLYDLQLKGYIPVLAHPERYSFYHRNFEAYYKLKKAGCLFQLNLLSLTPYYGKGVQNISKQLLKNNLYDFVGTDTHHMRHLDSLTQIGNKKVCSLIAHLMENNRKLL